MRTTATSLTFLTSSSAPRFGKTPEEAVAEVEIAKENLLAAARETGKPIPEPRYGLRSTRSANSRARIQAAS
jgi:predicted RNase H-like HicB family nuclease